MVAIITTSPVKHRLYITCPVTLHRTLDMYTGTQEILGNGGDGNDDHDNKTNNKYPWDDI